MQAPALIEVVRAALGAPCRNPLRGAIAGPAGVRNEIGSRSCLAYRRLGNRNQLLAGSSRVGVGTAVAGIGPRPTVEVIPAGTAKELVVPRATAKAVVA